MDDKPQDAIALLKADHRTVEDLFADFEKASGDGRKLRVLLDFAGEFDGMEAGAAWQDLTMGVREWSAWERIALVTDHAWMRDGLRLFAWAVPGAVRAFPAAERAAAVDWLDAG